jgi:hypothetical protein
MASSVINRCANIRVMIALFAFAVLSSCANGPCRHLREPQLAEGQAAAAAAKIASPAPGGTMTPPTGSVYIYKADGSLQCGSAKGLSLDEMEKQLNGIGVLSRDKRPDGRMHIQVCGSPTGMINVFEISATSLKEAEARGFKKL